METTVSTIETVLNNAFIINRKGTKHRKTFIHNTFERPITHLDFFQLLANSDINLSSFELTKYMCHIKATNYFDNWQGDVKLVVSKSSACIVVKSAEHHNIALDYNKFVNMFKWFKDEYLFNTDFGALAHSDNYYKIK